MTAADDERVLFTPAEAAQMLAVRESWLRRAVAARSVPFRKVGRHTRFSREDLQAIIDACAVAPATTAPVRRLNTAPPPP